MANKSKRMQSIRSNLIPGKIYPFDEALKVLKETSTVKFAESVDVAINLGVDVRKSDQVVRGATVLPNGTGKSVRVAVFAQGDNADVARAAGADIVGFEDLADRIKAGQLDFDIVIATPDSMRIVGQLGRVLGPRGLMPNPKTGTVTADVQTAVNNAKAGQISYRTDKNGIIHCNIGKINFELEQIKGNLQALMSDLQKAKPSTSKGIYFRKIIVSTTMGPGLSVDQSTLSF
jgi:large subunit ribosomal protein L1